MPPSAPPSRGPAADGKTILVASRGGGGGSVVGVLVAVEGPLQSQVFPIFDGENSLGRSKSARVHLESDYVSREHALIIHAQGGFGIKPLKDDNPTYVNDLKVEGGSTLSDGDLLRVGKTTLKFRTI